MLHVGYAGRIVSRRLSLVFCRRVVVALTVVSLLILPGRASYPVSARLHHNSSLSSSLNSALAATSPSSQMPAAVAGLAGSASQRPDIARTYGELPISFEGNSGQTDARVKFFGRGQGYGVFLTDLTSQRDGLIALFNQSGPGAVLYRLADDNAQNPINNRAFINAEYNRAFVATQYFGYLRRDPDIGGFLFWLGQVDSAPLRDLIKQHAMVCSFTTSAEYQQRFSPVVTHSNSECQ